MQPDDIILHSDLVREEKDNLLDTAMRDSAFSKIDANPQVVSDTKDKLVAILGQLFYSTLGAVFFWLVTKNRNTNAKHAFRHGWQQIAS